MARLPLCKGCILTSRPSEQTDRGNVSLKREQSEDAVLVLLIFKYTPQEFTAQTLPGISTLGAGAGGVFNRCDDGKSELVVGVVCSGDSGCSMPRDQSVHARLHHKRDPAGR